MSKNKSAKYKITDTDIDKKFIGKQVTVEKVKAKGGRVGPTTKKQKSTRDLLIEFMSEQREFNKSAIQRFEKIDQRFDKIEKEVSSLRSDISNLRSDFDRVIELNELER